MDEMIETIRAAVAAGATAERQADGVRACRTILAALEAQIGKPIALAGAPAPGPLAGIAPEQALDLLIARLSAVAEKQAPAVAPPTAAQSPALRLPLVATPTRPVTRPTQRVVPRRKP